jgi:hypothetical protein
MNVYLRFALGWLCALLAGFSIGMAWESTRVLGIVRRASAVVATAQAAVRMARAAAAKASPQPCTQGMTLAPGASCSIEIPIPAPPARPRRAGSST